MNASTRGGPPAIVEGLVGEHDLPDSLRRLSSLTEIDYADSFALPTNAEATAEHWARAMFGDVPSVPERLIWRGLLQLRLSNGRSPDTVAGWRITARERDWIRLEARSWFMTGNLVVRVADRRVSLTTLIRYHRRWGHWIWPPLSAVHRRLSPGLLRDAERSILQLSRRSAPTPR
jgi:hypothetical protein